MGDKQQCNWATDPNCPVTGHLQYNTDVAFDRDGRLLARYHKQNLFFEFQFNAPEHNHPTFFDTPFGRFGMFTCFDILFHSPAIDLIGSMGIRNIAFPTAWMDVLPYFAAIEFHSAYAAGLGLNLLAANLHLPEHRFQGSGIYSPTGAKQFFYNKTAGSEGRLLIDDLDILPVNSSMRLPTSVASPPLANGLAKFRSILPSRAASFQSLVFHDVYTFKRLVNQTGQLEVCHNDLCCQLTYDMSTVDANEVYAFGAFRGLHTYQGRYYIEVCILLKCATGNPSSCGTQTFSANTVFNSFSMQGNFSTNFVFPEILLSDSNAQLGLSKQNWSYADGRLKAGAGFSSGRPLLSVVLFCRDYRKDNTPFYVLD